MRRDILAALSLLPLLAACGPGESRIASTPTPRASPSAPALAVEARPPAKMGPRPAAVHMLPGLEGVIGASAPELSRLLGQPRIDVLEGDARKLQFAGGACVLDVYLYPGVHGPEPRASYVEARRAVDGADFDRVACVTALKPPPPVVVAPVAPVTPPATKRPRR